MLMKKLFLFVVVIIAFIIIGIFLFLNHPVTAYSGELKVNGIKEEVSVHYDQYAIPHINAKNAVKLQTELNVVNVKEGQKTGDKNDVKT